MTRAAIRRLILTPALLLALAGCAAGYRDVTVPLSSHAAFDAASYGGLWYEIARFPVPFQAGCIGATARYTPREDGDMAVLNACRAGGLDGPLDRIAGTARAVGPGRFAVRLVGVPVTVPYWVLWVDQDYRIAVVGVPSGRGGWILSRRPDPPADLFNAAVEVLDFNGYDTTRLVVTPQR